MKAMKNAVAVLALGLTSLPAVATAINPISSDGAGKDLMTIINGIYGAANLQRVNDPLDNIWWQITTSSGALVEAKYAGNNNALWTATTAGALDAFVVAGTVGASGTIAPSGNPFLFADVTPGGSLTSGANKYFVSDQSLNGLTEDHMVTFKVTSMVDTYVIAWEDLQFASSDTDYNDLVVQVKGVKPVPDGGASTLALLGGAMALIGAVGRKLQK